MEIEKEQTPVTLYQSPDSPDPYGCAENSPSLEILMDKKLNPEEQKQERHDFASTTNTLWIEPTTLDVDKYDTNSPIRNKNLLQK